MIIFQNNGVIDMAAVETFGASVKDKDNPIGMFGTGLKYAIAVILRSGDGITIFAGEEAHEYQSRAETIRGKDFSLVYDGDKRQAYTTDHGKNWEPWQAFRELWSNCHDEGGRVWWVNDDDLTYDGPPDGCTTVIWSGPGAKEVWDNRGTIILRSEPVLVSNQIEVHFEKSDYAYYQGIRVMKTPKPSKFTYNFLDGVYLTEDRTMAHWHSMPARIARAVLQSSNEPWIEGVLEANDGLTEGNLPWDAVKDATPTPAFVSVAGRMKDEDRLSANSQKLFAALGRKLRSYGYTDPSVVNLGPMALQIISDAKKTLPPKLRRFLADKEIIAKTGWRSDLRANYYRGEKKVVLNANVIDKGPAETAKALAYAIVLSAFGDRTEQMLNFMIYGDFMEAEPDRWIDEDSGEEEE